MVKDIETGELGSEKVVKFDTVLTIDSAGLYRTTSDELIDAVDQLAIEMSAWSPEGPATTGTVGSDADLEEMWNSAIEGTENSKTKIHKRYSEGGATTLYE